MHFDVNRLAQLAGLPGSSSNMLTEAGNRSQHEDPGNPDDVDYRWGKNQLAETGTDDTGSSAGDESDTDPDEEDYTTKKGKKKKTSGTARGTKKGDEADVNELTDVVLEIDESMLRREIMRMKRSRRLQETKERKNHLQEVELRRAVRGEIRHILDDLDLNISSTWVYGNKKPKNSGKGRINMGFGGIGFKQG